jgi:hypothetical protein
VTGQQTPRVVGSGIQMRVDEGHQAMNPTALDAAQAYAEKAGEHLWIASTCHRISPEALDRAATEPLILDAESLLYAGYGCFVCEQVWEPRLTRRRCPGEPR